MVVYHPAVQEDVSAILSYYDQRSNILGDQFWQELKRVIARAAQNPERYHPANKRLRRANLTRFPYHVLFRSISRGDPSHRGASRQKASAKSIASALGSLN